MFTIRALACTSDRSSPMKIRDFQESDVGQVNRVAPATFDELKLHYDCGSTDVLADGFRVGSRDAINSRLTVFRLSEKITQSSAPLTIELAFSRFKAHMKRLKPRTVDELWKAAGKVCDLFKPSECRNYFVADGNASE